MVNLFGELPVKDDKSTTDQNATTAAGANNGSSAAPLPPGVVLGKDGKPCRTCTSSAAWMAMMKGSSKQPGTQSSSASSSPTSTASTATASSQSSTTSSSVSPPSQSELDCPPSSDTLGTATWTLLHTLTATYPPTPTPTLQSQTASFIALFSQLYPCWVCAEDFQAWLREPANDPEKSGALKSQEGFGRWMCRAHNAVNVKLGKGEFNCDLWRERWRDGWKDGRCG